MEQTGVVIPAMADVAVHVVRIAKAAQAVLVVIARVIRLVFKIVLEHVGQHVQDLVQGNARRHAELNVKILVLDPADKHADSLVVIA